MSFGPDGRLYACCNKDRAIAAWDVNTGSKTQITGDVDVNDCVVNHKGDIWFTDHRNRQIYHVKPDGTKQSVSKDQLEFPNGIELSPDQSLIYASTVRPDGSRTVSVKVWNGTAHETVLEETVLPEGQ